ncbi:MAG: substrate-binding periplasmic protein [Thermodesulfobacteriota bacterium]
MAGLVAAAGPGAAAGAEEPLTIYYFSRPPLYMTDAQGRPGGVLLELTERIMQRAGLECRLVEVPAKRALLAIERDEPACGVGWYRLAEREKFAVFSLPIHRDPPQVAVVRRALARDLPRPATLDDLLGRSLVLGVIDGFNYGPVAERKMAQYNPRTQRITGEMGQLMRMTALGRCDWFLANRLEVEWHLGGDPALGQELGPVELADQPQGNLRYLMCGPSLGGAHLDRINRAILELVGDLEGGGQPQP